MIKPWAAESGGRITKGAVKTPVYLDKAKAIYKWEKGALFQNNGSVSDNMRPNGQAGGGALFYNQGTFFGPAMELFKITGDSSYYKGGIKAIDYVKNDMSNRTTCILNGGSNTGDGAAFLVIFIRNMLTVIMDENQIQYLNSMNANADAAWNNRRKTGNIMSSNFGSAAAASGLESSSSTGGVAMVTLAVLAAQPIGIAIRKKNTVINGFGKTYGEALSLSGTKITDSKSGNSMLLLQQSSNGGIGSRINLR